MTNAWQTKRLGEVCDVTTGKKDVNEGNPSGKYPFFTCAREPTFSDSYSFDTEALLVAGNGDVGHVSYYKGKFEAYQRTYVLYGVREILPHLLYIFLDGFLKGTISKQKLGNTMPYIKMGMLTDFIIPIPPLSEQKRLIPLLDKLFEKLVEAKDKAEKNLENAQNLLESSIENAFKNFKGKYAEAKLGEKATFRNGINFTKGSKGESVKIIGVKDFQSNFWIPTNELEVVTTDGKLKEIDVLKENDILVVRSNGNPELIGRCILAGPISEKTTHSGFTIRIRMNFDEISPNYLCHYLKSRITKKYLIESGTGVNIKSLNQQALSSLPAPIPPLKEQEKIVSKLDQLYVEVRKLEVIYRKKQSQFNELKQSILHQAFTGKL